MTKINDLIKSTIRRTGFELKRLSPGSNPTLQLFMALKRFEIDMVLDVGANIGQFAMGLRSFGYQGNLVSFEPLSMAHLLLLSAASRDARWEVHPRCAIGVQDGEAEINVSGNSVSSSLLPMLTSHSLAAADSAYIGTERTPIFKLDSVAPTYLVNANRPFLKIDTQGFEWGVLDGALETLPIMRGILCELSLVSLYEGQHLWLDLIHRIESLGFTLWAIQPGFVDARDGRTLQFDAVFFRS